MLYYEVEVAESQVCLMSGLRLGNSHTYTKIYDESLSFTSYCLSQDLNLHVLLLEANFVLSLRQTPIFIMHNIHHPLVVLLVFRGLFWARQWNMEYERVEQLYYGQNKKAAKEW